MNRPDPKFKLNDTVKYEGLPFTVIANPKWFDGGWHYILSKIGSPVPEVKLTGYIFGIAGCYCHPFNNWEDCDKAHNQRFKVGDPVYNRHTEKTGVIDGWEATKNEQTAENVYVKYGELASDIELEHVARLVKVEGKA